MFVSALPDPTCNSEIQRNLRMVEINKYYYYYGYYYYYYYYYYCYSYHDIKFNQFYLTRSS